MDKDKKQTTHQGYYWVYYDTGRKLALFDYQPGRGALYPKAMLHQFKGKPHPQPLSKWRG